MNMISTEWLFVIKAKGKFLTPADSLHNTGSNVSGCEGGLVAIHG